MVGRRAGNGATQLSGAVDSLSGSDVDTAGIEAHQAVAEALGRLTRLKPATLNEWQPIRTRVDREASDLPEELGAEVTSGLEAADAMVTSAASTWAEWQDATEGARTAKEDDLEAVQDAREEIDTVLAEFEVLDENLAGYLVASTPPVPGGPTSEALTTLTEAADARDGLRTRVVTLGTPSEVAEEISALADALAVHAGTVRAAADATGACILTCQVVDTPQWQALLAQREDQAAAVTAAVQAWREGSQDALKEIRQRELPDRPKI